MKLRIIAAICFILVLVILVSYPVGRIRLSGGFQIQGAATVTVSNPTLT